MMAQTDDGIVSLVNSQGTTVALLMAVTHQQPPYGFAPPTHSVEMLVTTLDSNGAPLAAPFLDLGALRIEHIATLEQLQQRCTENGSAGSLNDCAYALARELTGNQVPTLDQDFAVFRADAVYQRDVLANGDFGCLSWLNGAPAQQGHGTYTVAQTGYTSGSWFMGRRSADTSYSGWTLQGLEELQLGKEDSPPFPFHGLGIAFAPATEDAACLADARNCVSTASIALRGMTISHSRHARVTFARLNGDQLATAAWPAWAAGNYQTAPQTVSENAACPGAPEDRCNIGAFIESRPSDANFGQTCYIHNAQ